MDLLGVPLLVTLGAVTGLLAIATVFVWPRCRGGAVLAGAQRVGMILVSQLAAVLLAATAVNDYGYFFASWGQLRGITSQALGYNNSSSSGLRSGRSAPHLGGSGPSAPRLGAVTVSGVTAQGDAGSANPRQWPHLGRVESVTIAGGSSGLRLHAFVYLPPEYFQARFAGSRFPAAEVMTGYPGTDLNLVRRLRYPDVARSLVFAHRARPMVLVMLRPSVTFPRDTECTDVPDGPQALTFFAADVPAQIAHSFRVRPTGWGAIGDSTGGYCAAKIAMTHSLVFSAAVSLSGYYFALHDATTGDLWGGSALIQHMNDLKWRLRHLPAPPVSLLIATSHTERGYDGYSEARSFLAVAKPPLVADVLLSRQGGHNFATWRRELPPAMTWLSAKLAAVRGAGP